MNSLLRPVLFSTAVILALLAGLAALVYKTQAVDTTLSNSLHERLRDLKQLDAELNLDVLRTKNELNKNYDRLAEQLKLSEKTQAAVSHLAKEMSPGALASPADALKKAVAAKADLIEGFKTQNSVLKNSLRFFPTAALQLREYTQQIQGDAPNPELNKLMNTVTVLVANVLRFSIVPDSALNAQIEEGLAQLEAARSVYPPLAEQLGLVVSHGRVILKQKAAEDAILGEIAAVPAGERIDQLSAALDAEFAAALEERNTWRWILIAYSVGLLLLLMLAIYKLMQSYRSLNLANQSLVQANETLESRVKERTHDLSKALAHLKESELQLVQAEKMAALGQMVAGIAHEINTPLAYIRGGLEVAKTRMADVGLLVREASELKRQLSDPHSDQDVLAGQFAKLDEITAAFEESGAVQEMVLLLDDGAQGIDQIAEIVANLRNFSRLDRAKIDQFDVNEGIASTLKIARNLLKKRTVNTLLGEVPRVRCSPSQINQVFLNLITNACQATTEEEGKISIITRAHEKGVLIEFVDNGRGIAPSTLEKIFEPFFTSGKDGEGSGLGLSIVRRIVDEHGGRITVASRLGVGAKFSVYLPQELPAATEALSSPAPDSPEEKS